MSLERPFSFEPAAQIEPVETATVSTQIEPVETATIYTPFSFSEIEPVETAGRLTQIEPVETATVSTQIEPVETATISTQTDSGGIYSEIDCYIEAYGATRFLWRLRSVLPVIGDSMSWGEEAININEEETSADSSPHRLES